MKSQTLEKQPLYSNIWVAGFVMSVFLVLMIHDALYFETNRWLLVSINLFIWVLYVRLHEKTTVFFVRFLSLRNRIIAIVSMGTLLSVMVYRFPKMILGIWGFISWASLYSIGLADRTHGFEEILLILLIIVLINSLIYKLVKTKVGLQHYLVFIVYYIVQWNKYIDTATTYLGFFLLGIIMYSIYKNDYTYSIGDSGILSNKRSQLLLGLFVAVCVLSVSNVVLKIMPLEYLNEIFSNIIPDTLLLRNDYKYKTQSQAFDLAYTIYQPNKEKLGGSITLDESVRLIVESTQPGVKLRGNVKDNYTGERWTTEKGELTEFTPAFPQASLIKVSVNTLNTNSSILLTPLNTVRLKTMSGKALVDKKGVLNHKKTLFSKFVKEYTAYSLLDPLDINLDENQKKQYLQLPQNYSADTIALTKNITSNAENDQERAEAIEDYLRSNYEYSLEVSDYDKVDFVEHFLFEGKEGYCTYFASAMVVMSRIVEIPARYVEGYILPSQRNDKGIYRVTADRAHAWPELYIEGVGWHTYEPTPAYNQEISGIQEVNEEINTEPIGVESEVTTDNELNNEVDINKGSIVTLLISLLLLVFAVLLTIYIYYLRMMKAKFMYLSEKDKSLKTIYQIFNIMEGVDKSLSKQMRPGQKMQHILKKIPYDDLDESVIINAMNMTLFSSKYIDQNNVEILLELKESALTYMKKNGNKLEYIKYIAMKNKIEARS